MSDEKNSDADKIVGFSDLLGRHPTPVECGAAGRGPGVPNTPDERVRFEAYMRGHCWDVGGYDAIKGCFDTTLVRMLYGVWRDRGALPAVGASP